LRHDRKTGLVSIERPELSLVPNPNHINIFIQDYYTSFPSADAAATVWLMGEYPAQWYDVPALFLFAALIVAVVIWAIQEFAEPEPPKPVIMRRVPSIPPDPGKTPIERR